MSDSTIALFNDPLIVAASMGATITSASLYIGEARTISAQFTWSAGSSPVGAFSIQCSNDNTSFADVASSSVSGSSGTALINFDVPGFYYARIVYTRTSGSATGSGWLSAKSS